MCLVFCYQKHLSLRTQVVNPLVLVFMVLASTAALVSARAHTQQMGRLICSGRAQWPSSTKNSSSVAAEPHSGRRSQPAQHFCHRVQPVCPQEW
jgi:hypothetical protein